MGAAPLLLAMAIVTADVGWESDGRGGYQYIVQVPAEQWESIRREGEITSQIPENLRGKVSSIKIRVGDGPMPRHEIVASSEVIRKLPGPPDTSDTIRAQGGDGFQMPPELQPLAETGKQALDNVREQAGNQINEFANQLGQRANEAVDNTASDLRDAATDAFNRSLGGNGSSGRTTNPATNPTTNPATSGPTTRSTSALTNQPTAGPTTAPGGISTPSPFASGDGVGFSNPAGRNQAQPTTTPTTNPNDRFTIPATTQQNTAAQQAAAQNRSNPTTSSGPSTAPTPNPSTSSPWSPQPTGRPNDPPSMAGPTTRQSTTNFGTTSGITANTSQEQRLRQAESKFQFDEYGDLIVDEYVLYVVGISNEVDIDATGRVYDKASEKWLRDNDPRYLELIKFVNNYNDYSKSRLAARGGGAASGLQFTNPSATPTTPSYQPRNPSNLFDSNPQGAGGFYTGTYQGGYLGTANPQNTSSTDNQRNDGSSSAIQQQIQLALLQRDLELAKKEKETAKESSTAKDQSSQQTLAQQSGSGSGAGRSPSDNQNLTDRKSNEVQAQPLFNFMLLLSILGNAYLGIAISRLLKRYRNLVASHRGNTLAA